MRALWHDSLGNPVDVTDIDKVYALNILMHITARRARAGWTEENFRADELTQKLRETVLNGREPNDADRDRAVMYNWENTARGLPWRADV